MGRKAVPTELKLLRGNPGKRPINEDEPRPTPEIPDVPGHLSKYAREEWDRITVELDKLGLLAQIDRAALSFYCTAWGRHVEAENHILAEGIMVKGKGRAVQNRWVGVSNVAMDRIKSMLAEFGLSPASRTRLSVKPPSAKKESLFG